MSLPADYHTHTPLCRHATGEPTELAAQAVRLRPQGDRLLRPRPDAAGRLRRLAHAGRRPRPVCRPRRAGPPRPSQPRHQARPGGGLPARPAKTGFGTWPRRHPWDYFIGSVHYISDSWAIDNPAEIAKWKDREPLEVWTAYFERLTLAAESGLFDIIGHADLCKKFAFYPRQDCTPLFTRFLQAAKRRGLAIELNTAGLRKDCREIYPSPRIVHLAAQLGVPICLRLRRPCPERGRPELRRSRPARPQRRLHPLLPLHQTPARGREALANDRDRPRAFC